MNTNPSVERGSLITSFQAAWAGLALAIRGERNLKIHVVVAMIALGLAIWLRFSASEIVLVLLTIGLVVVAEVMNTAVETTVNLCADEQPSDVARRAKDLAAGAVLAGALIAAAIGAVLYIPAIWERVK